MSDLVQFLLDRVAEDEQRARNLMYRAQQHHLSLQDPKHIGKFVPGWGEWPDIEDDARRWIAECEVKRQIVALHHAIDLYDWNPQGHCAECTDSGWKASLDGAQAVDMPCPTLRLLAAPYFDHPDFDPAWREPR